MNSKYLLNICSQSYIYVLCMCISIFCALTGFHIILFCIYSLRMRAPKMLKLNRNYSNKSQCLFLNFILFFILNSLGDHCAVTVTHIVLWFQKDAHSRFAVPHHCQTDSRFQYQVQANPSYPVLNVRAVSQVFLCIITFWQFDFVSL